ncbi:MAG: hypothetical protein AABY77_04695, partial [Nitrospirota bacterium]
MNGRGKGTGWWLRALGAAALAGAAGLLPATLLWAADPLHVVKSGTTHTLYGVAFSSPSAGWVVGGGGTILATAD